MTFILEKRTKLFYIVSTILLTTVLAIFYANSQKEIASSKKLLHTQVVINKSNEVLIDVLNIETGFRGYLLSGNKVYLAPYELSKSKVNANLDTLELLIKDNASQEINLTLLKTKVADRLIFTEKYLATKTPNLLTNSEKIGIIEEGKIITDKIRDAKSSVTNEELRMLNSRKIENENDYHSSEFIFFLLLVFLVTIFILGSLIIQSQKEKNMELESHTANQKSASQYALSLIEASLDPLVTISAKGKIMDLNEALVNITGVTRAELVGSDFFDYFTDQQSAREVYQEVFEKGSVADSPLTIHHKDGKLTDVLFNGSVYRNDSGQIQGVVIVARDIAEQKWALDLQIANKELAYQNQEKEKRANELGIANKELAYQNQEKEKRANELGIANEELAYQNQEKENRASELGIANKELAYQNKEKIKRADELVIAEIELNFQNKEKEKREIANKKLEALSYSAMLASQYSLSLIEASRDPLFTISPDGKITDTNQASIRVTDISKVNLIGSDFITYFTEPEKAKKGYEEVFSKGFVVDYPLTIKDGKLTPVLFNGSIYKDENGNIIGAVVVARDITEQKKAEKELIEAKVFAELATEIAEEEKRNAESATVIAENAVKAKQQFLSNMSHEIRTPMNAIIGFTKVVLKTDLTEKQKEYLSAIKMSGDALIVLINDILDLAKVDAGKMIFERIPFRLSASISAILHVFETKIQEKNLELVTEYDANIPKVLLGDSVRLHQIILNLVSNAIKFTSKGKITVSVRLFDEDEETATVEFAISDTGIGIDESKMDTIFDNFQQATSGTSRLYGGTGLGLAIVKQLVEPQGGTLNVESKINEGSTFSFTLNFAKTALDSEFETENIEMETEFNNIKVLVVEDMPLNQLLMKTILDDFGFERDIAENGKIAIEKLQEKDYDIVLMDLQMPVMNGFEATKFIRNILKLKLPIIALTADVTTVDLAKCTAVGMNDYIAKPVDERILYNKIVGLVKNPIYQRENPNNLEVMKINQKGSVEVKYSNLDYLKVRTKSNPKLMKEMISIFLQQTPPVLEAMRQSVLDKDWLLLAASAHKIIPSFSIMGMSPDLEKMARQIQEDANVGKFTNETAQIVIELETICYQACTELEKEFNLLKNI
jgi:PAS domain S-box-containing protein